MILLLALFVFVPTYAESKDTSEEVGDVLQIVIPVTALGTTFLKDDEEGRWQFVKSFATTMAATYVLKYAVNSERPDGGDYSFPSGHTSAAFSGASFLQRRYGWAYGIPAYALASYVGWSRVDADKHHVEDVVAGAVFGIASTYIFTTPYEDLTIKPVVENNTYGLAAHFDW
ncbi:phosphatase PAP2 family protein [Candidatus Omnitrophota bacterium]